MKKVGKGLRSSYWLISSLAAMFWLASAALARTPQAAPDVQQTTPTPEHLLFLPLALKQRVPGPSPTATLTEQPATPTPTVSPTRKPSATMTASATATASPSPTAEATSTRTVTPTSSTTATSSPIATATPTLTSTPRPTSTPTMTASPTATQAVPTPTSTLVWPQGIYGRVILRGVPVAGIALELALYDQGQYQGAVDLTETDVGGYYYFLDAPSLREGEGYGVRYDNDLQVEGHLGFWYTYPITLYTAGQDYQVRDFDIADVELGPPDSTIPQSFPITFQWVRREWASGDSYEVEITDWESGAQFFSGNLGWVSQCILPALPPGFAAEAAGEWSVWIWGTYGYGRSLHSHWVAFGGL